MPALTALELGVLIMKHVDGDFRPGDNVLLPHREVERIGYAAQNYADSLMAEGLIAVAAKRVAEAQKTIDACSASLDRAFKRSIEPQD